MGLREEALGEYEGERRKAEEQERSSLRALAAQAAEKFARVFGVRPDRVAVDHGAGWVEVGCEGLEFVARYEANWLTFYLLGRCPRCGQLVPSRPVGSRYALGQMLSRFRPDYGHHCPKGEEVGEEELPFAAPDEVLSAAVAFVEAVNQALIHDGHQ